ncbi:hypothetical protein ABCS02_11875 [Microbacterium sp. X-17]|uniref:hypothetical protein n=1 Tax=Microbacterium sp. X-17 TaxID=3144404 RepID=UPI0031F53B28
MARRPLLLAAIAAAVAFLAGCASGPGTAPSTPAPSASSEVGAAWLDGGSMVGIVTWGSSSCVPTAGDVAYSGGVLTVELVGPPAGTACTMDYGPRATPVSVPAGIDASKDVRVVVTGDVTGEAVLAGVSSMPPGGSAAEGTPSAGWTGIEGTLVLLTWGSSSCPPQIADAAATAPGRITVTEAALPADRACTADLAPRATVVQVPAVSSGQSYTLTLVPPTGPSTDTPVAGLAP